MFRPLIIMAALISLATISVPRFVQAQDPTNGDDLIFRAVDVGGSDVSFVIHRYTTVGSTTFTPPDGVTEVEYLIVGGGGGGGSRGNSQGGGGAGGVLKYIAGEAGSNTAGSPLAVSQQSYIVIVGDGGAGGPAGGASDGSSGNPSRLGDDLQAAGGGFGGGGLTGGRDGGSGGSGGGAGGGSGATAASGGAGTDGQGNAGGSTASNQRGAGGGGGAGQAGADASGDSGGKGGDGIPSAITGTAAWYAGGGGGSRFRGPGTQTGGVSDMAPGSTNGASGLGGGGDAGVDAATSGNGRDGKPNTGGGGGGANGNSAEGKTESSGGKGGSGIVVVRYRMDDVTGWNTNGYYALPDLGVARNVLIDDAVAVRIATGNGFSILPGGTLTVGDGASLAVHGTLAMQGSLEVNAGGQATIETGGTLTLNRNGGPAVTGSLLINGGNLTFSRDYQIAEAANVIMTAGQLNSVSPRAQNETFASLTVTGGTFRPGTGSWNIGTGVFSGGSGSDINIAANSGSELTFDSLTLTDLTSTTVASNNSFTIYGNHANLTTVTVGPSGLTLNNSRILMQWSTASTAGNELILGGDMVANGTSTIQNTGTWAGILRLNTTTDAVTRTFDVAAASLLRIEANMTNGKPSGGAPVGDAGIVKTGLGTLALTGANAYTGGTTVAEGVLSLRTRSALPASGQVDVAANAVLALGVKADDSDYFGAADVTALFQNDLQNISMADGALVGIDTAAGNFTYDGSTPDVNRSLVKITANTLTLTGENRHRGDTIVMAGTLALNSVSGRAVPGDLIISGGNVTFSRNNQIADTANVIMSAGRITQRNTHQETLGGLTITGGEFRTGEDSQWSIGGDVLLTGEGGDSVIVFNSGTRLSLNSLTLSGLNSTSITSNNSFTFYGNRAIMSAITVGEGGLTLNDSRVLMQWTSGASGNALILGGDVTATGESTIQTTSISIGTGWLRLNTTVDSVTRAFDVAANSSLWIDAIVTDGVTAGGSPAGAGGIIKTGAGSLTFAAANTYTGTTTVLAGTLEVTGSLASNDSAEVMVGSAGTTFAGTEATIVRRVANGASLAGLGSRIVGDRLFDTRADILAGTNQSGGDALPVGMSWRMFGEDEAQSTASYLRPVSDVLQLTGITEISPFVLQMSYDASLVTPATEGGLHLAWLDGEQWVNAVAGNSGEGTGEVVEQYWGSWNDFTAEYGTDLDVVLGSWGIDTSGAAVWAVLNHNSQFGVLVPEPGSLALLAFGLLGLLTHGRRRKFRM